MSLDEQIQLLIDNAPQDGVTPQILTAIAPGLKLLASKLGLQYYILQNLEQDWVVTTLSDRTDSDSEKRVIYAFPTLQAASAGSATEIDFQVVAASVPVTHILFQLFALETVDSIIFFESGELAHVEVRREDVQNLVQRLIPKQIPFDIA